MRGSGRHRGLRRVRRPRSALLPEHELQQRWLLRGRQLRHGGSNLSGGRRLHEQLLRNVRRARPGLLRRPRLHRAQHCLRWRPRHVLGLRGGRAALLRELRVRSQHDMHNARTIRHMFALRSRGPDLLRKPHLRRGSFVYGRRPRDLLVVHRRSGLRPGPHAGLRPLRPRPGALPLDPARGCTPRPRNLSREDARQVPCGSCGARALLRVSAGPAAPRGARGATSRLRPAGSAGTAGRVEGLYAAISTKTLHGPPCKVAGSRGAAPGAAPRGVPGQSPGPGSQGPQAPVGSGAKPRTASYLKYSDRLASAPSSTAACGSTRSSAASSGSPGPSGSLTCPRAITERNAAMAISKPLWALSPLHG